MSVHPSRQRRAAPVKGAHKVTEWVDQCRPSFGTSGIASGLENARARAHIRWMDDDQFIYWLKEAAAVALVCTVALIALWRFF